VQISDWTIIALAVVVLLNTVFIGGICVALFLINKRVDEALAKAQPILDRATETLGRVEETTVQLQHKVDQVLDKATELVEQVSERVDTTTAIAEEAVTEPLIGAASLMAGINRGLRVYTERSHDKGDGRA
jgi:F0F1-type ATP synthase membrane subunit b/b'